MAQVFLCKEEIRIDLCSDNSCSWGKCSGENTQNSSYGELKWATVNQEQVLLIQADLNHIEVKYPFFFLKQSSVKLSAIVSILGSSLTPIYQILNSDYSCVLRHVIRRCARSLPYCKNYTHITELALFIKSGKHMQNTRLGCM